MTFRIAFLQFQPRRKDVKTNLHTIHTLLDGLTADLVVLPELSNSGYLYESPQTLKPFAEQQDGNGVFLSALRGLAGQINGIFVTGYAEVDGEYLYNSAAAVSAKGIVANYRKTHLYADEKDLFQPGDTGFITFQHKNVVIGMMICFDWIFPEAARALALAGAQVIAHPANLVMPYCQDAMVTRSLENKVFTITANRIGKEQLGSKELDFTGISQITTPNGEILYRAPKEKSAIHVIEIDPEIALDKHISPRNNLFDDRRSGFYKH